MRKQSGFAIVEIGLILFVVVLVGAIGYMVYDNFLKPKPAADSAAIIQPSPSTPAAPVVVKSATDLDTVASQLSNVSLDDTDNGTLDNATNF